MSRSPRVFLAALPLIAVCGGGCVINVDADQVVVREEKQFEVGPGAEVSLETFDGSVRVQAWNRREVVVEIQKRGPDREAAASLEVRSSQEGNRVRVEAPRPKVMREFFGIGNYSGPSVSFVVRVPENVELEARTSDGSIAIENVAGTIDVRSGDGSITAERVSGSLNATTGDGSVRATDVRGTVALESGDGSIHVEGTVENLRARTRDGSVVIEAGEGSVMKDNWQISTGDGSITFRVPQNFNAEIDAQSRDGRVRSEIDGLESARRDNGRGTLRGRIGTGGHTVTLRTGDGSIAVLHR